ncbi:hypothetical protein AK812_SmicGene40370 [Symbiodinium microadriaticum]|uniref:Uncharacterized protein n=1 Tax=Symbiodinium microadriaticum TaxID=2951 RepID=A0A1Q9C8R8_SYMMI|nr:hypothetical protein AK812_SmicGene40370 [Symbiodinium microadriaticum]
MSIVVLDGVVDNDLRQLLLSKFDPLAPGAGTALPEVFVPKELEQWLQSVLRCCAAGQDPSPLKLPGALDGRSELVPMPGRVAVGSPPMHQDTGFDAMGRPDPTRVEGLVAVLYLAGAGTLVIDTGSQRHSVEVKPCRLVVWPNDQCIHRLDASPGEESRIMLGPMTLSSTGWKHAGDQYDPAKRASDRNGFVVRFGSMHGELICLRAMSIVVLDGVVDNDLRQLILSKFDLLAPGARTALPEVLVPKLGALDGRSELVPMPGRVAVGSPPMHQDTGFDAMGRPDPTRVEGLVAVLYLAGAGTLVIDTGSQRHSVEVKPCRLVVWPNDQCIHRLDASPGEESRIMLGPMTLSSAGWKRAGDQYSVAGRGSPCFAPDECRCPGCQEYKEKMKLVQERRLQQKSQQNVAVEGQVAPTDSSFCVRSCAVS